MATRQVLVIEDGVGLKAEEKLRFEAELREELATKDIVWVPVGLRITAITVDLPDTEKRGPLTVLRRSPST